MKTTKILIASAGLGLLFLAGCASTATLNEADQTKLDQALQASQQAEASATSAANSAQQAMSAIDRAEAAAKQAEAAAARAEAAARAAFRTTGDVGYRPR